MRYNKLGFLVFLVSFGTAYGILRTLGCGACSRCAVQPTALANHPGQVQAIPDAIQF